MTRWLAVSTLGVAAASLGCSPRYLYRFDPSRSPQSEPTAMSWVVTADPSRQATISLELTNHTDVPAKVIWNQVTVTGARGLEMRLRPVNDVGSVLPGRTLHVELAPFVLSPARHAHPSAQFVLHLPMTVSRETVVYDVPLTAKSAEEGR